MTPIRKTSAILAVLALGILPTAACKKKSDAPAGSARHLQARLQQAGFDHVEIATEERHPAQTTISGAAASRLRQELGYGRVDAAPPTPGTYDDYAYDTSAELHRQRHRSSVTPPSRVNPVPQANHQPEPQAEQQEDEFTTSHTDNLQVPRIFEDGDANDNLDIPDFLR